MQQRPYHVPYSQRELVKQELDSMLKAKVITSPWASPIVLVNKRMGMYDFLWTTESSTSWPDLMRTPCRLTDTVGPARVISTLDLAKGYWQDEESRGKDCVYNSVWAIRV